LISKSKHKLTFVEDYLIKKKEPLYPDIEFKKQLELKRNPLLATIEKKKNIQNLTKLKPNDDKQNINKQINHK